MNDTTILVYSFLEFTLSCIFYRCRINSVILLLWLKNINIAVKKTPKTGTSLKLLYITVPKDKIQTITNEARKGNLKILNIITHPNSDIPVYKGVIIDVKPR